MTCGNKGQMFIAAAIVMIVGLFVMKNLFSLYTTVEEKRYQETLLVGKHMDNIKREYEQIIRTAAMQNDVNGSGMLYLSNFSNYLGGEMNDFKVLYVFVCVNHSSQKYSVTVGNFLKDKINVTVNVTDSTPSSANAEINDKRNTTWEFQGNLVGANITLVYDYQNSRTVERFPIYTNKNLTSGFFDIILENDVFLRKKVYYQVVR